MSVWIVSYYSKVGLNLDRIPTIIGVYKSEDDAFKVAVTRDGHYKLSQTPNGVVWMYGIKNVGEKPIEFEKAKKLVRDRKDGYYNHYNPYRSGGWFGDNYTILENKIKTVKISIPKTKIITGKHKCDDCGKTYKSMYSLKISTGKYLHKFYGRNCPACNPYIEIPDRDRWYLTSEKKNKLPKMKYTGYHLTEYGAVLMSNTTPPFLRGREKTAIGSDKQKDGYLSLLTDEQIDEIYETDSCEGSIEIDETWRKGNNKPILFSDYLKMTSQDKKN